ncbi:integrase core domain-containing protein [Dyella ginsengisoli]
MIKDALRKNGVQLRLIERRKPNQNAYIESFNGCLRGECLRHWFPSLLYARAEIERCRREITTRSERRRLCAG